ncbi:MAG TPA: helix-turn-helix domain-containing protein, partial [Rhodocyclaceae bacterium]|nr:helix-turn-helix domain-containing protein [Rhodocyclaceae bacterium]
MKPERIASTDRRVQRTRNALREALVELMMERTWDEIGVQDICERANIGRSTFYMHFSSKDEWQQGAFDDLRREIRARHDKAGFARNGVLP